MVRWKVDKRLSYYPSNKIVEKMRNLVNFLATQGDRVPLCQTQKLPNGVSKEIINIRKQFGVGLIWIERLDKLGVIRLESKYIGSMKIRGRQPVKFFISLWDGGKKKAEKLFKKPIKETKKLLMMEDNVANRVLKYIDEGEKRFEPQQEKDEDNDDSNDDANDDDKVT